jgi:hypothetical protein
MQKKITIKLPACGCDISEIRTTDIITKCPYCKKDYREQEISIGGNVYTMYGAIKTPDWEFQVCKHCGREQRLDYQVVDDDVWEKVAGLYKNRVLCVECFLKLADDKKIELKKEDIRFICVISKTDWQWNYN